MNHITRAVSFLSDLGIVILFKESDAVVLPETVGPELSDHKITPGFKNPHCAPGRGTEILWDCLGKILSSQAKEFKTFKQHFLLCQC